jgi:hypothetical protein
MTERAEPNRLIPTTASEEARRAKVLKDKELPIVAMSKIDIDDPTRLQLLSDMELPKHVKSRTENVEPNRGMPKTDRAEPMRP